MGSFNFLVLFSARGRGRGRGRGMRYQPYALQPMGFAHLLAPPNAAGAVAAQAADVMEIAAAALLAARRVPAPPVGPPDDVPRPEMARPPAELAQVEQAPAPVELEATTPAEVTAAPAGVAVAPVSNNVTHRTCSVCLIQDATRAFVPCGHFCVCSECANRLRDDRCPLCRQEFTEIVTIF